MEVTAIIPARGGSKTIKRKNLIEMPNGMSLVEVAIDVALRSQCDRVIVTTEDAEIADIARNAGAYIVKRPSELAQDHVHSIKTIMHVIEFMAMDDKEIIFQMLPTSPLVLPSDLNKAICLLNTSPYPESVVGTCMSPRLSSLRRRIDNVISPIFKYETPNMQRQQESQHLMVNGALFLSTAKALRKYKTFHTPSTIPYIMPRARSIDIDTNDDASFAYSMFNSREMFQ